MEQCCPSPEHPVVQPDDRGRKLRVFLKYLYYGQMMVCFIKFLLFGAMTGLFQLINLWVIYTAFATLHFCSILIYLIMSFFDLLFLVIDYKRLIVITENSNTDTGTINPIVIFFFALIGIYYILAVFYCYRAYGHFKNLFMQQHADLFQRQPDGDGRFFNDDHDEEYQAQQRRLREQHLSRIMQQRLQQQVQQQQQQQQQRGPSDPEDNREGEGERSVNSNVYLQQQQQPNNSRTAGQSQSQQQPFPPNRVQEIIIHDFRNRVNQQRIQQLQQNQQQNNNNSNFKAFQGQGHKIE